MTTSANRTPTRFALARNTFGGFLVASSLLAGGCADAGSTATDPELEVGKGDGAVRGCEFRGKGNDLYKSAVELAKTRERVNCEVLQTEIIAVAQAAVRECPAVGGLIATSQWAGALRTALGPLEVAHLAGKLVFPKLDDEEEGFYQDDAAIAKALGDGQTFTAIGQGVYGPQTYIHFEEGNRYRITELQYDRNGDEDFFLGDTSKGTFAVESGTGALVIKLTQDDEGFPFYDHKELALDRRSFGEFTGYGDTSTFRVMPLSDYLDGKAFEAFENIGFEPAEWLYSADIGECSV